MGEELLWIEEIKHGKNEAFNKIIDKYQKRILNYFYRWTGNKEDAQDLTQELFSRVFNNLRNFNFTYKFTTWIYKIAYNLAIDFKRKKIIDLSFDGESNEELAIRDKIANDEYEKILNLPEQMQIQEKIKKALIKLPENQRQAIILKVYEEKSYEEIAEIMEISKSAVESLLFRARENLKKYLIL